jgi:hypothetical protein
MKSHIASLSLLVAYLAAVPAMAQISCTPSGPKLCSSGQSGGNMCTGYPGLLQFPYCVPPIGPTSPNNVVADGFTLGACNITPPNCNVTGLQFLLWVFPGDVPTSVQVSIYPSSTTFNFASPPPPLFTATITIPSPGCYTNDYGFDVCTVSLSLSPAAILPGSTSYYLVLSNATTIDGETVGWDQNGPSGPGYYYPVGTGLIPHKVGSETFTLLGY